MITENTHYFEYHNHGITGNMHDSYDYKANATLTFAKM